jgi:hypothetical protein
VRKSKENYTAWEVYGGTVLAVLGVVLIGVGGSEMHEHWVRTTMYVAGFIACLSGTFLIWTDLAAVVVFSLTRPKGNFLGEFRLNGNFFEAYEREEKNGTRRFRLLASSMMDSAREAACIRYLVNEGLIEELWPQMSQKIKEEADWAFQG